MHETRVTGVRCPQPGDPGHRGRAGYAHPPMTARRTALALATLTLLLASGCPQGGEVNSGAAGTSASSARAPGAVSSTSASGMAPAPGDCPAAWLEAPGVDAAIAVPPGAARVVFHAAAAGTQNYACRATPGDAGTVPAWSFTGPEATLSDCKGTSIGKHFATDGGAPEWQLADGASVVAHKVGAAPRPDAVPWLLLSVDSHGGSGALTEARFVHRVRTTGGVAPKKPCDASVLGAVEKVPYTADYYFYGP
jgi:hypothetical protein